MRILIADGESRVRSALRLLLRQRSDVTEIYEAENMETMLHFSKAHRFDIVLLDWNLPATGGHAALKELRTQQPQVAIVVLSGRPEVRSTALATGANAFVSKGDPPEQLLATIELAFQEEKQECVAYRVW
jgi:DNA-binding NarL/FixJ family response regulator